MSAGTRVTNQARVGVCARVCGHVVENRAPVPKANGVFIYSLGQIRGQTLCPHGYFIKLSPQLQSLRTCMR